MRTGLIHIRHSIAMGEKLHFARAAERLYMDHVGPVQSHEGTGR